MKRGWFFFDAPPLGAKKQASPPSAHLVDRKTGAIACAAPNLIVVELSRVPRGYVLCCSRCMEISESYL